MVESPAEAGLHVYLNRLRDESRRPANRNARVRAYTEVREYFDLRDNAAIGH